MGRGLAEIIEPLLGIELSFAQIMALPVIFLFIISLLLVGLATRFQSLGEIIRNFSKITEEGEDDEEKEELSHQEADESIISSYNTTMDAEKGMADIIQVELTQNQDLLLTLQLPSGERDAERIQLPDEDYIANWKPSNKLALLFEYLELTPPERYDELTESRKHIPVRETYDVSGKANGFTIDFDTIRNNLPENAFSNQTLKSDGNVNEKKTHDERLEFEF